MWALLLGLGASVFSVWTLFKQFLVLEIKLDEYSYKTLYEVCKDDRKFLFQEELTVDSKAPLVFNAFCMFKKCPWFFINHTERLLTAGFQGKELVTWITCLRWDAPRIKKFISTSVQEMQLKQLGIPVELILPHYKDRIGILKYSKCLPPVIPRSIWGDIDEEIEGVFAGKFDKTSVLMHGTPGNGKTSFVKYLASKYKVPIRIMTFSPEYSNHDLMRMFSGVGEKCIVLFEDFDNYFDQRKCIIGSGNNNIKFTFDIILNGLDGVYNSYEGVVFIMSVNDLDKVDTALKNRPSRFKYVREFPNPNFKARQKLVGEWADKTDGLNLDQLLRLQEFQKEGCSYLAAVKKLGCDKKEDSILLAAKQYQLKIADGSHPELQLAPL